MCLIFLTLKYPKMRGNSLTTLALCMLLEHYLKASGEEVGANSIYTMANHVVSGHPAEAHNPG